MFEFSVLVWLLAGLQCLNLYLPPQPPPPPSLPLIPILISPFGPWQQDQPLCHRCLQLLWALDMGTKHWQDQGNPSVSVLLLQYRYEFRYETPPSSSMIILLLFLFCSCSKFCLVILKFLGVLEYFILGYIATISVNGRYQPTVY